MDEELVLRIEIPYEKVLKLRREIARIPVAYVGEELLNLLAVLDEAVEEVEGRSESL